MVAYSFKERFAEPILVGSKRQTIRGDRRRHARPDEQLQLYIGMRTKRCRLIARTRCVGILAVRLRFSRRGDRCRASELFEVGGLFLTPRRMDRLAADDGFASVDEMAEFWFENHGRGVEEIDFHGVLVRWAPLVDEPRPSVRSFGALERAAGIA